MRIASNLKKSLPPIVVPCVGTCFYENGRNFQITNVSLSMNRRGEHIMKVEGSSEDCYLNVEMISLAPFVTQ
jgi:hypothetical protein